MPPLDPDHPHLTLAQCKAGLPELLRSPQDSGRLRLIVWRPETLAREALQTGRLDVVHGLVGDNWQARGSTKTSDGAAHLDMQITLMNARVIALLAQEQARWPLAGDQLYVDLDLSIANLPTGTRLHVGSAVLEVTAMPHTGCKKFAERFGADALRFLNSAEGKRMRMRGIYAKVAHSGEIAVGDTVRKVDA